MTDDEARKIATQAIDTWPNGPKAYVWINELRELDADTARAAMRRLRRESDRATTAQFHAAYRAERIAAASQRHDTPHQCEACNGTGWVEATPIEAHNPPTCKGTPGDEHGDGGCWCTAVKPCRCTRGRAAQAVADQINDERRRDEHGRSSAVEAAIARIHAA